MGRPDPDSEFTSDSLLGNASCCLCFPCFGRRRSNTVGSSWWDRTIIQGNNHHHHQEEPRWWVRAVLKMREWSEIVAGPRWKTFIRRFNRNRGRYDPLSYTLNFDEGQGQNEDFGEDDDDVGFGGLRSFSTRYASVPLASAKVPAPAPVLSINRTL